METSNLSQSQMANSAAGAQSAGVLASAFSSIMQGSANRRIAGVNQRLNDMQARDAISRGKEAEKRLRSEVKQLIGTQRAAYAAQGVDIGVAGDSAAEVAADTAALGELDALMIRNNARREAFGIKMQGLGMQGQARMDNLASRQQAFATLISGAGSTFMTYRGLTG